MAGPQGEKKGGNLVDRRSFQRRVLPHTRRAERPRTQSTEAVPGAGARVGNADGLSAEVAWGITGSEAGAEVRVIVTTEPVAAGETGFALVAVFATIWILLRSFGVSVLPSTG